MLEVLVISLYFNFQLPSDCFPVHPIFLSVSQNKLFKTFLKLSSNLDDSGKQYSCVVIVDAYLLALTEKILILHLQK